MSDVADILMRAEGMVRGLLAGRGPLKGFSPEVKKFLSDMQRARGSLITASSIHDSGAYARCSYCDRYTANPCALSSSARIQERAACDCGMAGGWSGSFKPPGPDAQWSIGLEREP